MWQGLEYTVHSRLGRSLDLVLSATRSRRKHDVLFLKSGVWRVQGWKWEGLQRGYWRVWGDRWYWLGEGGGIEIESRWQVGCLWGVEPRALKDGLDVSEGNKRQEWLLGVWLWSLGMRPATHWNGEPVGRWGSSHQYLVWKFSTLFTIKYLV